MKLQTSTKYAAVPTVLLLFTLAANNAYAWDGCGWSNCGGYGFHHFHYWGGVCGYGCEDNGGELGLAQNFGTCEGCDGGGGYQAGISDAIFDHDNGNTYNPVGQCLPCHSDYYWNNFHEGYDHQWNSYQNQESNQGSSITINGNNNYVSTSQLNNQQQNPLQQLAHVACGLVNCNQQQVPGYEP